MTIEALERIEYILASKIDPVHYKSCASDIRECITEARKAIKAHKEGHPDIVTLNKVDFEKVRRVLRFYANKEGFIEWPTYEDSEFKEFVDGSSGFIYKHFGSKAKQALAILKNVEK